MSDSSNFRLDGRVAIVTGGAGGIGYETAKALQESGAQTALVDINPDLGEKAAKELETAFFQADLTKSEQVKKVADQVQQKYGRLDIAFNNAGITCNVPSEDCSDEDWLRVISVNLNAVFFCCREFGKVMLQQGKGSIINTASMSGIISNTPQPQSAYNASKGGRHYAYEITGWGMGQAWRASQFRFPWVYRNRVDQEGHVENRLV